LIQLGSIYNGAIGRIPQVYIKNHLFKDSLPGPAPVPVLTSIGALSALDLSNLIKIENVAFPDISDVFAPQTADATSWKVSDAGGNIIEVRTSKYANFAGDSLPKGIGTLVGVYSTYNGTKQLTIRDRKDIIGFKEVPVIPQNVPFIETFDSLSTNWKLYSVASNKNWLFSAADKAMSANGYGGDVASDDWLITPPVKLSNFSNYNLSFTSWTKYIDNGLAQPMEVLISTNYKGSGNPTVATWTALSGTLPVANSQVWTPSGAINLNTYSGQTVFVAFRYRSSGTTSSTASNWKVDEVSFTGN